MYTVQFQLFLCSRDTQSDTLSQKPEVIHIRYQVSYNSRFYIRNTSLLGYLAAHLAVGST